jgi:hypothetical protein
MCLLGALVGCLNPFPDDQPQNREAVTVEPRNPQGNDNGGAALGPVTGAPGGEGVDFSNDDGEANAPADSAAPDAGVIAPADAGPDAQAAVVR